ncbi:ATP-binding protein [candidate division WOR-3 bacterium]|nr:ATP-binding protein [candidate division WOR-3 bacterium]
MDYEKLGLFYIGREIYQNDLDALGDYVLYDSRDLLTHSVCLGMTGSGKTGLCVTLLEEAAIDGIPAVVIDPKGDISNLLLTFPDLKKEDFLPWIDPDEARKEGLSETEYAEKQANLWRNGIAEWHQDAGRIKLLKNSAEFRIYTPGSSATEPVSILKSLDAPSSSILSDIESLSERANSVVTSLLNLVGIEGDPIKSREHVLLSNIFDFYWKKGMNLGLEELIRTIQKPPMKKIGVADINSFLPDKDRFSLSMRFNNILASPSMSLWTQGAPLDMDRFLYSNEGKPRISIFSISHLNDNEKMFFVSLFLTNLLDWTRSQPGTSSLRAIFYMDEIMGYFPPVSLPPSKPPLLTLLKQARAYGLGIVLATQNPADLDYKGLSNIGTWFIGRLQTARDKEKLLEGLEGVRSEIGLQKKEISNQISSIGKRVFLMRNVHNKKNLLFKTRWALSYLRGPLTKEQLKRFAFISETDRERQEQKIHEEKYDSGDNIQISPKPLIPDKIKEYFIYRGDDFHKAQNILYKPMILTSGKIFYETDDKSTLFEKKYSYIAPLSDLYGAPDLEKAENSEGIIKSLESEPQDKNAGFEEIPSEALKEKYYGDAEKNFIEWIARNAFLDISVIPSLKLKSLPGEDENGFRLRISQSFREKRDLEVEKLREKYALKLQKIEEKERKTLQSFERKKDEVTDQKSQSAISFGTTFIGAFLGGRRISASNIGRAATSARSVSRVNKKSREAARARENYEKVLEQKKSLNSELDKEISVLQNKYDISAIRVEKEKLLPKKKNIIPDLTCLAWLPVSNHPR